MNTQAIVYSPETYIANDIGTYRTDYPKATKVFSDQELFDIVMATEDDMEAKEWRELFKAKAVEKAAQPKVVPVTAVPAVSPLTAREGDILAHNFTAKGGPALNALLVGIADQKAAERMGSLHAALFLETHYTLSELPVVGSKKGDTGNLPFDKYPKKVTTTEGERTVPGSFYTDVIHDTSEYARIKTTLRWLAGNYQEGEVIPDDIKAIAKTGAGKEMAEMLNDRVSDMRVGLTKGSMLLHHVDKIASINPERIKVKMPYRDQRVLDANGQPIRSRPGDETSPFVTEQVCYGSKIRLMDPAKEFEDKVYSVSSFLQLKPNNDLFLKQDVKTIVNLDETTTRPPAPDAPVAANAAKVPTTVEGGLTLFNALASWLDGESEQGVKTYARLLEECAKEGAEGDETVTSIGKVCFALDGIWTVIQGRYTRIQEEKAKARLAAKGEGRTG